MREAGGLVRPGVGPVGAGGNGNQRQRARLGRDNGQADDDPGRLTAAEKVILDGRVRPAKATAEDRDADEIDREDGVVESRKAQCGRNYGDVKAARAICVRWSVPPGGPMRLSYEKRMI